MIDIASVNPYFHLNFRLVRASRAQTRGKREVSDGCQKEEGFEETGNEKEGDEAQGRWTSCHEEEGHEAKGDEAQGRREEKGRTA